ncbi:serine/threonine protein kinase [Nocardia otitidiscaviarum]|uniref:protein kinase domain-containing protein n=1 Tax=Nocardia otitidiscaviarum TaxID=1823 RepID=UPI000B132A55|nr:serine/threonine-protein kinase [Nocardia otitidiscaviarum]MBF6131498.1 serine/threonine protein kinase [Nocardia otitidiscaviarum]MBF6482644.1 serine/threonine protein kinase [Nocardia otitidiscaviarum]
MEGTVFGRYRLLGLLGEGGMGQVHRAYDTETDRVVALKVLPPDFADDPVYRERFRREAQAAAKLTDPHIIPIHAYGEIDGRLFLDMRLVEGIDMSTRLAADGPMSPTTAVSYVGQIAAALDAAHRAGLLHRDVKPSNVLTTADGFAYLIDFGIARGGDDSSLTTTGAAVGTFAYMAPERLAHDECDGRADVYSLACVLYECLAGAKPFPGDSVERQIAAHLSKPPPRPSLADARIPATFDEVIAHGMAKDPAHRYPSAGALAAAAREALTGGVAETGGGSSRTAATQLNTTPAPPPTPPYSHPVWTRTRATPGTSTRRTVLAVSTGVALLLVAVVVIGLLVGRESSSARPTGSASPGPPPLATTTVAATTGATTPPLAPTAPALGPSRADTTTEVTTPESSAVGLANYIRDHYALLPSDTAAAWARLTPRYQGFVGGYAAYQDFWGTVGSVTVSEVSPNPADLTVTYRLSLRYADGRTGTETRRAQLVRADDAYRIDSAELVP